MKMEILLYSLLINVIDILVMYVRYDLAHALIRTICPLKICNLSKTPPRITTFNMLWCENDALFVYREKNVLSHSDWNWHIPFIPEYIGLRYVLSLNNDDHIVWNIFVKKRKIDIVNFTNISFNSETFYCFCFLIN